MASMSRAEYLERAYEFASKKNRSMTMAQAEEIRRRVENGESQKKIANELGKHKNTIWKIVNYMSYWE